MWRWILRTLAHFMRRDALIDHLIAGNAARRIDGMERIDWCITGRIGQRRWDDVLRAQRRQGSQNGRKADGTLLSFGAKQ